jgi:hypothetical protein
MPLTDWHLINISSINGATSFSLTDLNQGTDLQNLLIQTVIKRILTVPGSDAQYPQIGSNIGNLYGTMTADQVDETRALFPVFLKTIKDDLISEQELIDTELLPAERLLDLRLVTIEFDARGLG